MLVASDEVGRLEVTTVVCATFPVLRTELVGFTVTEITLALEEGKLITEERSALVVWDKDRDEETGMVIPEYEDPWVERLDVVTNGD